MYSLLDELSKSTLTKEEILALNNDSFYLWHIAFRGYFKELREFIKLKESEEFPKSIKRFIPAVSLIMAYTGNTQILKYLIKNDLLDVDIKTKDGSNCFIIATRKGHIKILKILVKYANIKYANDNIKKTFIFNCCNGTKYDALQVALYWGYTKIADYLISIGFDMYFIYAKHYWPIYINLILFSKTNKSLKFLDKKGYIISNKDIIIELRRDVNVNTKIFRYFYGKGGRFYNNKYYFSLSLYKTQKLDAPFYINYICINKLLFI